MANKVTQFDKCQARTRSACQRGRPMTEVKGQIRTLSNYTPQYYENVVNKLCFHNIVAYNYQAGYTLLCTVVLLRTSGWQTPGNVSVSSARTQGQRSDKVTQGDGS